MTAPGVGALTALSVASAFDDPGRFQSSRSVGAYLGLTPSRYESGEVGRSGGISKQGNGMTRKHLYEAATTLLTRTTKPCALKDWGLRLAKAGGFKRRPGSRSPAGWPWCCTRCGSPAPSSAGARLPPPPAEGLRRSIGLRRRVPAGTHGADRAVPSNAHERARGPPRPIHHRTPAWDGSGRRSRREL